MDADLIARYDKRVPRYTSYPTAPHFHDGVNSATYEAWLGELTGDLPLSLYVHVPFCDTLCWFCGCHTKVVNRYDPVAGYLADLLAEIDLVAARLGSVRRVGHLHLGGGSPTMLRPDDLRRVGEALHVRFAIASDAEFAVEIDPRGLAASTVQALAAIGVNRVSFGLQDINPAVQQAINRLQPPATNRRAVDMVREAGIAAVNVDLIYGLPHQTVDRVLATVEHALSLEPDRVALFGYAHVPTMKRHQRLIPEATLPDAGKRFAQAEAAAQRLVQAGYQRVGLDHFARGDDPLACAARQGHVRRNFQGYGTDPAEVLIGFGASAIGTLPQGYVQNETDVVRWRAAIRRGELPTARGVALSDDDRTRRDIINALMCDLFVDLNAFGGGEHFSSERAALGPMIADGLVALVGEEVRVTERGRPLVRSIAAVFDSYLDPAGARHSRAI